MLKIIQVSSEKHIKLVKKLFREYADYLDIDLEFQNFNQELKNLPGDYSPPEGELLLAFQQNKLVGCVALRKFDRGICEMKRLYVREKFRGKGIGKTLSQKIIKIASNKNFNYMCLDTLPYMKEAISLYKSLGFKEIPPYRHNPIKGAKYFQLKLN